VSPRLRRAAAWLAGVWAGLVVGVGFVAAPVVFATLPRGHAGRVAARLFAVDAMVGIGFGAVLLVLALQIARRDAGHGASRFSTEMLLALGAIFCIVAGHYAIQPMIETAGQAEGGPSFAVLHGVASAFFALKFVAIAVLAWRLSSAAPALGGDRPRAAAPTS
jgi:GNAT superfamily N-acetyltransferase